MKNGGIIGIPNSPTITEASGVWGLREQLRAKRDVIWPSGPTASAFVNTYSNNSSLTTYNFTTASIGPSLAVIAVHSETTVGTSVPASSVTIGGVTATQAVSATSTGSSSGVAHVSLWYAELSSSTTSVTVNYPSGPFRCGIGVYTIQGYISTTPTFTGSDTDVNFVTTRTVNTTSISSGSAIIAAHTSGNVYAHTWSGVTERYDEQIGGGLTGATGASLVTTSTQTHTIVSTTGTAPSQGTALGVAVWR